MHAEGRVGRGEPRIDQGTPERRGGVLGGRDDVGEDEEQREDQERFGEDPIRRPSARHPDKIAPRAEGQGRQQQQREQLAPDVRQAGNPERPDGQEQDADLQRETDGAEPVKAEAVERRAERRRHAHHHRKDAARPADRNAPLVTHGRGGGLAGRAESPGGDQRKG